MWIYTDLIEVPKKKKKKKQLKNCEVKAHQYSNINKAYSISRMDVISEGVSIYACLTRFNKGVDISRAHCLHVQQAELSSDVALTSSCQMVLVSVCDSPLESHSHKLQAPCEFTTTP